MTDGMEKCAAVREDRRAERSAGRPHRARGITSTPSGSASGRGRSGRPHSARHDDRGIVHLTETRWLALSKFFVEIFGNTLASSSRSIPTMSLSARGRSSSASISERRTSARRRGHWSDPTVALRLRIRAPNGAVVDEATTAGQPGTRSGRARDLRLPPLRPAALAGVRVSVGGRWTAIVSATVPAGRRVGFGVSVVVASSLGIDCELRRDGDGRPIRSSSRPG